MVEEKKHSVRGMSLILLGFGAFYLVGFLNFGALLGKLLLLFLSNIPFTEPSPYFQGGTAIGAVLFLGIVPPIAEELFFRKVVLQKLNVFGSSYAVVGSALLFFIYHTNITAFEPHVFFLGIVLAYIMVRTNNIVYPILIHSVINVWATWTTRIVPGLPPNFKILCTLSI